MIVLTDTSRPWRIDLLAEIYREATSYDIPWIAEDMSGDEMIRQWFDASWFEADKFITLYVMGRPAGFAFIWWRNGRIRINPYIDPRLPRGLFIDVLEIMLSWTRLKGLEKDSYIVQVFAGPEYGILHRAVQEVLGVGRSIYSTYIMLAPRRIRISGEPVVEIIDYRPGLEEAVASIYNDAFSLYPWFTPISPADVAKMYKSGRIRALIAMLDGEPVGYVDFMTRGIGVKAGYIYTLAVKKKYHGMGIGRKLLAEALRKLREAGLEIVYLDAYPEVVDYYMRCGFKILRRYINIEYSIEQLPKTLNYMIVSLGGN